MHSNKRSYREEKHRVSLTLRWSKQRKVNKGELIKALIRLALVCLAVITIAKPTSAPINKQASVSDNPVKTEKQVEVPKPHVETVAVKEEVATPPPAPQPERPAPVATPVQAYPTNCEAYRPIISKYGWNVEVAMNVMRVESGCNPNAANLNDNHGVCIGSFGLFQISCHGGQIYNPEQNIAAAWAKYQARGWQPWGSTTCKYKVKCY